MSAVAKDDVKTAAAYIRVSTDSQTELSPDSQIKVIQQFAKQNGYIVPKEFIFRDDGISGRSAQKRPRFNMMIAAAKQKPSPFSAVLLWKFSRFARNQEESIFYKSMLRKNGIEVISISEPMVDGAFGTLIERIIEWSDEYYSIRLSGEVKRGMQEKVERGGAVAIPSFGYNIENKKYIVNPETAPIVKQIFNDYLNGVGSITIAKKLNSLGIKTTRGNAWENRTVDYILQNPIYIGKIRWNPKRRTRRNYADPDIIMTDGQHEAIIDIEIFNKVQEIFAQNRKKHISYAHSNVNEDYMLHGLVKCSDCGATLTAAIKGASLQCSKYTHGKCGKSHSISIKKINEMIIIAIDKAFKSGSFDLTVRDNKVNRKDEIDFNTLIDKENLKLRRIKEAFEDGVYTLEEYKESREIINNRIKQLENSAKKPIAEKTEMRKKPIEKNKNVAEQLKSSKLSESEKNALLCSFVDKIVFNRAASSIELFFYV